MKMPFEFLDFVKRRAGLQDECQPGGLSLRTLLQRATAIFLKLFNLEQSKVRSRGVISGRLAAEK